MSNYENWTDKEIFEMFHHEMETLDDLDWDMELQQEYYKRKNWM